MTYILNAKAHYTVYCISSYMLSALEELPHESLAISG